MTNPEKRALSLRIATLAEELGLPEELVWEAAETCPAGHDNRDLHHDDVVHDTGEMCRRCWDEQWREPRRNALMEQGTLATDAIAQVDLYEEALGALYEDTKFRPEWRIGKQAKDLTRPEYLLPLVEAWRSQRKGRSWRVLSPYQSMDRTPPDVDSYAPAHAAVFTDHRTAHDRSETDPWEALAYAFAEALEVEKGEST